MQLEVSVTLTRARTALTIPLIANADGTGASNAALIAICIFLLFSFYCESLVMTSV